MPTALSGVLVSPCAPVAAQGIADLMIERGFPSVRGDQDRHDDAIEVRRKRSTPEGPDEKPPLPDVVDGARCVPGQASCDGS